jgi:hypothetical protein
MQRRIVLIGAILAMVVVVGVSPSFGSADRTTVGVDWHPQQASLGNEGPVDGASATLTRNSNGISYRLETNSLTANSAYTLWVVVVNNPAVCDPSPCTAPDILLNPTTDSQVLFGTGLVAGGSGKATFAGSLNEGALPGWLQDRSFDDATTAEIHLVLNDHGPKIPAMLPDMMKTYRGGCSDESPFPGIFPATALADGEVGPNTCLLSQSAVFAGS